ncbi:MAG: hypothetical protein WCR63_05360, partial [Bacilli bacterium]
TFDDSKEGEILKGAYIFGPNSAVKSNFLNGITYMKYIVLNSFARDNLLKKYLLGYYGAIPCLKDIDFGDE